MVGFALLLTLAGQVGILNPFQGVFLTATAPVEGAMTAVFEPVAAFLSDAGSINSLRDENRQLRLENEDLRRQVTELQDASDRVKELEDALNLPSSAATGQKRLAANIVHRDSSAFTDVVSIDKGTKDGLKPGMVVISSRGTLMGTITKALSDHSFVRLITDSKSRVASLVLSSRADGIVKGTANRTLTFDLAQADIKVGDTIVTSSLTGRFPEGLPIGKVTDVSGTAQDVYRTVKLEPFVRMSTATAVLVLTSFVPQTSSAADSTP
jgi:rod shape-determining protein MreC